jgi:hypothetical protein
MLHRSAAGGRSLRDHNSLRSFPQASLYSYTPLGYKERLEVGKELLMNARGNVAFQAIVVILLVAVVGLLAWPHLRSAPIPKFQTEYQAVLLTGGQAFYGKLEGFGTSFPVLTDIHYVQSQVNPETKAVTNILIQRGKEWHGPDRMYLNPSHILWVEPVAADSQVAKFIAEKKGK